MKTEASSGPAEGTRPPLWRAAVALAPWLAVAALAVWVADPSAAPLAVAAAAAALGAGAVPVGRRVFWHVGVVLLLGTVVAGFAAHRQVATLGSDWDAYWSARETEVGDVLADRLERRQAEAEIAADALAEKALDPTDPLDLEFVRALRARHGLAALALYDAGGRLIVWDGAHWGKVPESVQGGFLRHTYLDRPLFGYLYVTALTEDGRVAVAADLLRADLPEVLGAGVEDFSSRFLRDFGERVRVTQHDPGRSEGVWDLSLPDRRLMSVVVDRPSATIRSAEVLDRWRLRIAGLLLCSWLLLALGASRAPADALTGACALWIVAALMPAAEVAALGRLFDARMLPLPGGAGGTPGRALLLVLALTTVVAALPRRPGRIPLRAAAAGAAVLYPLLLFWVGSGEAAGTLVRGRTEWVTFQATAALALALATSALLGSTRHVGARGSWRPWGALVAAVVLGAGAGAWVWLTAGVPVLWWSLWAVPTWLAAGIGEAAHGWRRLVAVGGVSVVIAGTAAVPATWSFGVSQAMADGVERLEGLTSTDDPALERGLQRLAVAADSLDAAGREGVDVLYHAWRSSGLAGGGYPVRLTRWTGPDLMRGVELRVGAEGILPGVLPPLLAEQQGAPEARLLRLDRDDARYVLTVPLSDGGVLSVVAPPFSEPTRPSSLDPFVRVQGAGPGGATTFIALVPGDSRAGTPLAWDRDGTVWRAGMGVRFANDRAYHAHHSVVLPGALQAVARATLLLVLDGVLLGLFWALGAWVLGGGGRAFRWPGLSVSFRARVTWALFGFFALAIGLFGAAAYRTVSQASYRSAEVIAERVVDDAAVWYRTLAGGMDRLARQVGSDLVVYRGGELAEGSVEELVELGLYEAWTPFAVREAIEGLSGVKRFTDTQLGRWAYVTAFRRLPDGDVLAAQVPLQAGTAAIQATDLLELLGFFVAIGGTLSWILATWAGRWLTRPIHELQVASERVGSGNLRLRLPEGRTDEFGQVFRAFNRMVEGVRSARRQLVRTSRRTQLIMDEAAVGMLAVDRAGRITLVNPRARELLGEAVVLGEPLRRDGAIASELADWLARCLAGEAERADHELQSGERRIRLRARRLGRATGGQRGAVVAMDDVTDELRAERVLAWGEMARQVAHEVKNPLTPIKLSIQHVRRAWQDGRPDFEEILLRNAQAMLTEIDRLAAIAQSFSRFGAPAEAGVPLAPVALADAVGDVMALYGSSVAAVHFTHDVPATLPRVVSRTPELKEVLVNLLENARLASADGGEVGVRAWQEADRVVLEVADQGVGIPEDVLPRIFEPQFSTRSTGAGLGLAIVRRLVRSWGADVEVRSRVGEGTTFRVALRPWIDGSRSGEPVSVPAPPDARPDAPAEAHAGGDTDTVTSPVPGPDVAAGSS